MNTLDLLSTLPPFRDWSPADILASPAWAMPCRLGPEEGRLVSEGAMMPVDPLRLAIRFADASATLALSDSPLFPELHALWPARAEVPATILLALVERECGPLLQLLENAAGRELAIDGLADTAPGGSGDPSPDRLVPFSLHRASGETLCTFALTLPPALVETFGALRNLDVSHLSICDLLLPTVVQIAAPVLSATDLENLAPGDHLLLPEVVPAPKDPIDNPDGQALTCPTAALIVADRLAASAEGIEPWSDSGALRIVLSDPDFISFGELTEIASGGSGGLPPGRLSLREGTALSLLRGPATLASGRIASVAGNSSFEIESVLPPQPPNHLTT